MVNAYAEKIKAESANLNTWQDFIDLVQSVNAEVSLIEEVLEEIVPVP